MTAESASVAVHGAESQSAEPALRAKESDLDTTLRRSPFMLTRCSRDLHYRFVSDAYARMIGRTPEEIVGRPIIEIMGEDGFRAIRPFVERVLTGELVQFESVVPLAGVGPRSLAVVYVPDVDADGAVVGWVASIMDVTGQRRAEEALRESEARFRAFVTASSDVVYRMSADWSEMRHLDGRDFIADTAVPTSSWMEKYIHPDDRELVLAAIRDAIHDKRPFELEHRVLRVDGTLGWTFSRAIPILDANAEIVEWFGAASDVTRRHEAEQALRESERRFRTMADSAPIIIWVTDTRGEVEFVNREYLDFFGVTEEQVRGAGGWHPLVHLDDEASYIETFRRAVREQRPWGAECRVRHADGRWRWIASRAVPRFSELGEFLGHVGCSPDITERRHAEDALRQSEERLRLATQAGKLGLWEWDIASNRVTWSESLYAIHGVEREAFDPTVEGFAALVHPDDRPFVADSLRRALEQEAPYQLTFRAVRPSGEVAWLFTNAVVLREGHDPTRMLGATMDVTELKRTEEALRESEQRFRVALEHSPILVYGADRELRYQWIYNNPERFGDFDVIGKRDDELLTEGQVRELVAFKREVLESGQVGRREIRLPLAWRVEYWDVTAEPLHDERGAVTGLIVSAMDITDRKAAEEALRDADRRKDEFLATLAHELRNPLAPVRNSLQILRLAGDNAETRARLGEVMERQVNHMVRLVDDLLDVSRITRGRIELRRTLVELAQVVHNAVETSSPAMTSFHHHLDVNLPDERVLLEADPVRLAQVIANLLHNAAKYTPEGGWISLAARCQADTVVISVRDTGVGIPPEMLPRIFEPFTQGDQSLGRAQGGLGIGLTLVKRLVELHGGTVEARSEGPGQGSEFVVRLPLHADAGVSGPQARAPRAASPRQGADHEAPLRVLVVDDNRDAAESLAALLRLHGSEVETMGDGRDVPGAAERFHADVILLDIGLPGMSGYEVARQIRATAWGQAPVLVAVTGWGQEEDRRRSREAGFDAHLVKPVDPVVLEELLASVQRTGSAR